MKAENKLKKQERKEMKEKLQKRLVEKMNANKTIREKLF